MLYQVIEEIERANGPVLLTESEPQAGDRSGTLGGQIQFWVRKGRLRDDDAALEEGVTCASGTCGSGCGGASNCAFVVKLPKTYSIPAAQIGRPDSRPRNSEAAAARTLSGKSATAIPRLAPLVPPPNCTIIS